jgi:oligopeptidase A
METNLLNLPNADFPNFALIKAEDVVIVIDKLLAQNNELLEKLLADENTPTWGNFIVPLDEADDYFARIWSAISHMHAVKCEDDLRAVYEIALAKVSEHYTMVAQNAKLYEKIEKLAAAPEYANYDDAQKKTISNHLRDFRLSGVNLAETKKQHLRELKQTLSQLTMKFEQNIMDATDSFSKLITTAEDLVGIPEMFVNAARIKAERRNKDGWEFGLDAATVFAVLSYAKHRDFRENIYRAYVSRASDIGSSSGSLDNSQIMVDIIKINQEIANILGFDNYAELSLETKMATDVAEVMKFLADLAIKAKPQAQQEYADLVKFAKEYDDIDLMPWDLAYYSEILRQQRYKYSSNEYREYFSFDNVIAGLFTIVSKTFSLSISEVKDVPVWHESVVLYEVRDKSDDVRGYFYIDLYAREKKRGGAWMDDYRTRRITKADKLQLPVAFLNCNFSPAVGDAPALLSHDDVVTVFHEFGHTLHHILTKVDYSAVSGIAGVMWDAVELPSQFLEHWSYSKEGIEILGKHYKTGAPLPEDMLDNLLAAKNFQSAMQMMRQLEFALFDMQVYSDLSIASSDDIQDILDRTRAECAVVPTILENRFQHSFSHIFAGGYAAGYYSYKWAEVLSSDAFTKFEEFGIFNSELGEKFMHAILEKGGTYDADVLFKDFMGRAPEVDALLRHSGIEI